MSATIDPESVTELRKLKGETLRRVAGVRYPGLAGYSEVRLLMASERQLAVRLRMESIDEDLEVCVPVVSANGPEKPPKAVDIFDIAGFRVTEILKLQRREWIEVSSFDSNGYTGTQPRAHRVGGFDEDPLTGATVVDAGIALISSNGLRLDLYADTFPLIFQLTLSISSSEVPAPKRCAL